MNAKMDAVAEVAGGAGAGGDGRGVEVPGRAGEAGRGGNALTQQPTSDVVVACTQRTTFDVVVACSGRVLDVAGRAGGRFFAADLCVDIARALVGPLAEIKKHDAELWDQGYRALKGMALCVAEGGRRRKMDRANFFDMAAGSAQELRMALTLAVTFGAVSEPTISPIDRMIDRLLGMLWKLARRAEADAALAKRKR